MKIVQPKLYKLKRYHSSWRYILRYILQSTVLRLFTKRYLNIRVAGLDNVKEVAKKGPFIVTPNHQSHFDTLAIIEVLPKNISAKLAIGAAKDTFFKSYLKSKPIRALINTYPIDRDKSGMHRGVSQELIKSGVAIMIFPEGTRSRSGNIGKFHSGVARISLACNTPIVPTVIVGTEQAWGVNNKKPRRGRHNVAIEFLPPIYPKDYLSADNMIDKIEQQIKNRKKLFSNR